MKCSSVQIYLSICLIALTFLSLPTQAQRSRAYRSRGGFYVGAFASHNSVSNAFDGKSVVVDISQGLSATVPSVETFFGYGAAVGIRTLSGAFEVNYQRYQHDVSWNALGITFTSTASVEYINVAMKRYWLSREKIQPALHLGWIPYSRIHVAGGMITPGGSSDTRYRGSNFGFNGGLGLLIHLGERLSAEGLVLYRYLQYEKAEAQNGSGAIEFGEPISGNGFNGSVGLSFVLF